MKKIDRENVLVYIYTTNPFKVLVLKRLIDPVGVWQPVSGGIEKNENHIDTIIREVREETGITSHIKIIDLDYTFEFYVPSSDRNMRDYCYGMEVSEEYNVTLTEHSEYKWLPYKEAYDLLEYDENKTVLTMLRDKIV